MMWKDILGWPYEVSDSGLVRRLYGKVLTPIWTGKKRKQYATVILCNNGWQRRAKVHVLVLEVFVGPRPEGMLACHKDDDTKNNKLKNLYWGTHSDNVRDTGRVHNRLTPEQISEIRQRRASGERGIHRDYGVSMQMICDIVKGRCYAGY